MKLLIMQFSPTSRLGLIEIKSRNLLGGTREKHDRTQVSRYRG
jgi:hypothetical protein